MPSTKTLYTPVFFSSSEPPPPPRGSRSTTSVNLKVPSSYLNALSRTHIALAQIVQEVPSSRPGSPTEDADGSYPDTSTQERVSVLRARVQEAWSMADGNPADGKWNLLTHLLRMSVTSGKAGRWAGTRADLKAPDPPESGWINALTEAEWAEWEKRLCLKDKVENWKSRLETQEELENQLIKDTQRTATVSKSSHQEEGSIPIPAVQPKLKLKLNAATSKSAVTTNSNPLKDNSIFGFAVVKRSNPSMAAVGKKPHVDSNPANQLANDTATIHPIRKITDIPETSFLPPSFPTSQLMTSTPNAKPISSNKRKPEPIPFTASPLPANDSITSPLTSPRVKKLYGRVRPDQLSEKSSSLPAIPSATSEPALFPLPPVPTTPTRDRDRDAINHNNKRPSDSPNHVVKKARTMPSLDSPPLPVVSPLVTTVFQPNAEDGMDPVLPTTPKRQNLPTLTELLASAKKGKKKPHSPKGLKPDSAAGAVDDSSTKPVSDKSKFRFPSPLPYPLDPAPPLDPTEDNPYMLDPYTISVNHSALELGIDLDVSPTKSLSSLAGSDSEDEHEEDELKHQALGLDFSPSSFNPYATSTQHPRQAHKEEGHFITSPHGSPYSGENGRAAVLSLGFVGGYNSQFDVAGQVDKVDKLLEKDVDYEGWLRDPSLEREGVQVDESP